MKAKVTRFMTVTKTAITMESVELRHASVSLNLQVKAVRFQSLKSLTQALLFMKLSIISMGLLELASSLE